jgi:flagellar protein FliS
LSDSDATRQAAMAYQRRDIETADPLSLIVRVLDLAAQHLARARAALAANDLSAKGELIHKTCRCLDTLQASLDMDQGAEVAQNLDRLYGYMQRRLSEGHLQNDDSILGEVANHVGELASAWREVAGRKREPQRQAVMEATP